MYWWQINIKLSTLYRLCLLNFIYRLSAKSMRTSSACIRSSSTFHAAACKQSRTVFQTVENSMHRCPINPTGAALESNQCWLNPSYWWIYQPLAEVPEAPGFVVGPYCQLSLSSSTRNPNPSLTPNHLLTTLITTSRLQKKGFQGSFIPGSARSMELHFTVELEIFWLSRG